MKSSSHADRLDHISYRKHRRELWTQILLPVLLGALVLVLVPVVAWLTVMRGDGDTSRWAAISTMWLLIPIMIAGLIGLALLIVLIYVGGRITGWIAPNTYRAQLIAQRAAAGTRSAAAMIRNPVLAVRGLGTLARSRLQRLRERI